MTNASMVSSPSARTEPQPSTQKVVVVMPAYNAGRTLDMLHRSAERKGLDH